MQKLLFFVLLLTLNNFLNAQSNKNNIKLNFIGSIGPELIYERALSQHLSFNLSGGMNTLGSSFGFGSNKSLSLRNRKVVLIPEARYYFKNVLKGFYTAIFSRTSFSHWALTRESTSNDLFNSIEKSSQSSVSLGNSIGYQFLIKNKIALDFFLGLQYNFATKAENFEDWENESYSNFLINLTVDTEKELEKRELKPRIGFSLGYSF